MIHMETWNRNTHAREFRIMGLSFSVYMCAGSLRNK